MYEITTANPAAVAQAQDITGGLFRDFVSVIDRSENTTRAY